LDQCISIRAATGNGRPGICRHRQHFERWEIYWAAGVGTMGSSNGDLEVETRFLTLLLHLVESESRLMMAPVLSPSPVRRRDLRRII